MKPGLAMILQTLTPEAAAVLNQSISEATRRNHGQTTPLHVAATLLAPPSGYLRQACIRSHPDFSPSLQCRALQLCFTVALDRLPTAAAQSPPPNSDPTISNALIAALKRAQAHQRRECPDQHHRHPLLAPKAQLEQLIISILDDPSVSRVMREAGFSSPAVKDAIEQSLTSQAHREDSSSSFTLMTPSVSGTNLNATPRLQRQGNALRSGQHTDEEVRKVIDIFSRAKRRNPILVGESKTREAVFRETLSRIQEKEVDGGPLRNVAAVIAMDEEPAFAHLQISAKIKVLGNLIEGSMMTSVDGSGVIIDMGDIKWLLDQPSGYAAPLSSSSLGQEGVSEAERTAAAEIGKLLSRYDEGGGSGRLWLIGTATCGTYLRCQAYYPTMENDWDLQAQTITAIAPLPGVFPRLGSDGIITSMPESLSPLKSIPTAEHPHTTSVCPQCEANYEELSKLMVGRGERVVSVVTERQPLPQWSQNAKLNSNGYRRTTTDLHQFTLCEEEPLLFKQKSQELQKQLTEKCSLLHPCFHDIPSLERIIPTPLSVMSMFSTKLCGRQPLKPVLQPATYPGEELQLSINSWHPTFPQPASPVTTDLVLGKMVVEAPAEKSRKDSIEDFLGVSCISSKSQNRCSDFRSAKPITFPDMDLFKKLLKGLIEKVAWQREAASAVATAVAQCRTGSGKGPVTGSKGDVWLLFLGPDKIGKMKMAGALSELVYGVDPVRICLGSRRDDEESDLNFHGKTAIDHVVEAIRRNPFSVIVLQDIDEADMLVQGNIRWAMERGRLVDSHGRETSLGNVIFILTANWILGDLKCLSSNGFQLNDEQLTSLVSGGWQLRLSVGKRAAKRRVDWWHDEDRVAKKLKGELDLGLSFDLNQIVDTEDDGLDGDGSRDSSDLTVDHEVECGREQRESPSPAIDELLGSVDGAIIFKPVDFTPIQCNIENAIMTKFSAIIGSKLQLEVEQAALERILGGTWLGQAGFEAWIEKVLIPSLQQLKASLPSSYVEGTLAARLELDCNSESQRSGDLFPSKITVAVDGK